MNLTGHWKGTIIYGPEYDEWENKELFFSMSIQQHGDTFSGSAIDTGGLGCNPDEAIINGFISGNKISFTKQYKSTLTYNDDGQLILLKDKPSHVVEYVGSLDPILQKIDGEWEINVTVQQFKDEWLDETSTGFWSMIKE